ncbi:MAG: hypothetical protein ABJB66_19065 [Gemmatimonadaceae bacterium]
MHTNLYANRLGVIAIIASLASASLQNQKDVRPRTATASPCSADSNYQRLAFWVGDWEVLDSTGARYAAQNVRAVVDGCAITAEWTGRAGNRGLSVSAFDVNKREWKQVYMSNQIPSPSGVPVRHSDSTYHGPGVRFIPSLDAGEVARSRVTIMPLSDDRALQLFEDSPDSGKTWRTAFKAEHRRNTNRF